MSVEITVEADVGATEPELVAIADAFRRAGFEVRPEAVISGRSGGPVPWVLYITISAPIAAFFGAFASSAGEDAYAAVKRWAKELWAARLGNDSDTGSVVVQDVESTNLVLRSALPDEALEALAAMNWPEAKGDYLVWNEKRRQWLDPMKHPSDF